MFITDYHKASFFIHRKNDFIHKKYIVLKSE